MGLLLLGGDANLAPPPPFQMTLASIGAKPFIEWVELRLDTGLVKIDRVGSNTIAQGQMFGRLRKLGTAERALSDDLTGSPEVPSYVVELYDGRLEGAALTDGYIRQLYYDNVFKGREIVAKSADLQGLMDGAIPVTLWRGIMGSPRWRGDTCTIPVTDFVTYLGGVSGLRASLPFERIDTAIAPSLPINHRAMNLPRQYVFGIHDDASPGYGPVEIIPLDYDGGYRKGLVSFACVESIDGLWVGTDGKDLDGEGIVTPGTAGWTSLFGAGAPLYREYNGIRCSVVLVGATRWHDDWVSGSTKLTCTCHGIEANGDGTGATLTDLSDIDLWVWANLILGQIRNTPLDIPVFEDLVTEKVSPAHVQAVKDALLAGRGLTVNGAFILGGNAWNPTVSEYIAMINRCLDRRSWWNAAGQFCGKVYQRDEVASAVGANPYGPNYLTVGELEFGPDDGLHYTDIAVNYGRMYIEQGWVGDQFSLWSVTARAEHGQLRSPVLEWDALRDFDTVLAQAKHKLARFAHARLEAGVHTGPIVRGRIEGRYDLGDFEPGDVRLLDYPDFPYRNAAPRKVQYEALRSTLDAPSRVTLEFFDHQHPRPHNEEIFELILVSITRSGVDNKVATFTVDSAYGTLAEWGITSGARVTFAGAEQPPYNGSFTVTVTGDYTGTYLMTDTPVSNATTLTVLTLGFYTLGERRVEPEQEVRVIDTATGTGPIVPDEWFLGGNSEQVLTPAASTYVDLFDLRLPRIPKTVVGRRKVIAYFTWRTSNGTTLVRPRVTLEDDTVIATGFEQAGTGWITQEVVLQDLENDIDTLASGSPTYKGRFYRADVNGTVRIYAYVRPK